MFLFGCEGIEEQKRTMIMIEMDDFKRQRSEVKILSRSRFTRGQIGRGWKRKGRVRTRMGPVRVFAEKGHEEYIREYCYFTGYSFEHPRSITPRGWSNVSGLTAFDQKNLDRGFSAIW